MVEHETEVFLLFYDFVPFLVEDGAQSVQGPVELSSSDMLFIKSEVQFLIFQCIQHVGHLLSHLSCGDQISDDRRYRYRCQNCQYDGYIVHQILYFFNLA